LLTNEEVRCGMCAGDLKYSICSNEYKHLIDTIIDYTLLHYVGVKTLLDHLKAVKHGDYISKMPAEALSSLMHNEYLAMCRYVCGLEVSLVEIPTNLTHT